MAAVSKPLRLFGVLEPDWVATNIEPSDSSFTEADPKPGTMATSAPQARLVPQVLGAQSQPATIAVIGSGNPFAGERCVQVGYYLDGETVDDVRGWEPPVRIADFTMPMDEVQSEWSDAVYLPLSGKIACLWDAVFAVWNPHTSAWEHVADTLLLTPTSGGNPSQLIEQAALAVVPGTERLLYLHPDDVLCSDDYGDTWVRIVDERGFRSVATDTGATYTGKMRACFDGAGGLLLVALDTSDASIDFFASADVGCTWAEVAIVTGLNDFDIAAGKDGGIYVVTITTADDELLVRRLGGAFSDPSIADTVALSAADDFGQCSISCDHAGVLWVHATDKTNPKKMRVFYSTDQGATFIETGRAFYRGDANNFPRAWRFVASPDGALHAATALSAAHAAGSAHAGLVRMGGWAGPVFDVPHQQLVGLSQTDPWLGQKRINYANETDYGAPWHWIASARPEDITGTGLSKSGTGTTRHSSTIVGAAAPLGFVRVGNGANANGVSYLAQTTAALTDADTGAGEFAVRVVDDGGADKGVFISCEVQGGGAGLDVLSWKVYFVEDGYRVWDNTAADWMGDKVLVDLTERRHFRFQFGSGSGITHPTVVYHRADGETAWQTDAWGDITEDTGGGSAAGGFWIFGKDAVANVEGDFWYGNALTSDASPEEEVKGITGVDGYGAIADELGRAVLPDLANHTAERASYLRLRGGPGLVAEEYVHDVSPGYPIEALFPTREPSPSRRWRSIAKSQQDIVIDLGFDSLPAGCVSYALVARDMNVRRVVLATREDGGGSYTTVGTMDLATGFVNLSYTLTGRRVVPAGVTAGARYLFKDELAGHRVVLDTGGTPTPRKVLSNTAGFFNAAAGPKASLILEDVDGTEATSGTLTLQWRSGVMPIHTTGLAGVERRYWRCRIPSTELAVEDFYSGGTLALVGLVAPGKQWAANWSWDLEPNISIDENSYRTQRRQQKGPNRRRISLGWDHAFKVGLVRGVTDADYLQTSAAPIVARDDVWGQLHGLMDQSLGGSLPSLLMAVDPGSGVTLTDRTLWCFGYFDGGLTVQNASGNEGENEFPRTSISFVELV